MTFFREYKRLAGNLESIAGSLSGDDELVASRVCTALNTNNILFIHDKNGSAVNKSTKKHGWWAKIKKWVKTPYRYIRKKMRKDAPPKQQ